MSSLCYGPVLIPSLPVWDRWVTVCVVRDAWCVVRGACCRVHVRSTARYCAVLLLFGERRSSIASRPSRPLHQPRWTRICGHTSFGLLQTIHHE